MILTQLEREFASYLRAEGLSYNEIAYLKWRDFDFEGDNIKVKRRFLIFNYVKRVNVKRNSEAHHILKTLEAKRRYQPMNYYVFYAQFPIITCRRDDARRYGSPFTPVELQEQLRGYSNEPEVRPLFGLKLVRV